MSECGMSEFWNLEFEIWHLEFGIWNLAFGILEFGIWNLEFWNLAFDFWDFQFNYIPIFSNYNRFLQFFVCSSIYVCGKEWKIMKFRLTLLFLSFAAYSFGQDLPKKVEDYYDFWVGEWEANWSEGEGKTGYGTNTITKILDGKVIHEDFKILKGENKGFLGTSISVYQVQTKQWRQSWADNQNTYFSFTGKLDGEKRIFQTGLIKTPQTDQFTQRMVFYDIKKDAFNWDWESSTDGGKTWTLNWRIRYTRKK